METSKFENLRIARITLNFLKSLHIEHEERFKDLVAPGHYMTTDECSFLWPKLLRFAMENFLLATMNYTMGVEDGKTEEEIESIKNAISEISQQIADIQRYNAENCISTVRYKDVLDQIIGDSISKTKAELLEESENTYILLMKLIKG